MTGFTCRRVAVKNNTPLLRLSALGLSFVHGESWSAVRPLRHAETGEAVRLRGHGGRPSRVESAQLSDRILDVATMLFLGDGFGATSIEAVAKRAGISKRTFYHRFRGKEELFEAVVRRMVGRWTPPFDATLLDAPSMAEALEQVAEYMLRVALTPQALALHRMMVSEGQRFPALARILHELGAATGIEWLGRYFEECQARGEIGVVDAQFAAEQFIMMVVTGPRRRALGLGALLSAAELQGWVTDTVRLFLDGCRPR